MSTADAVLPSIELCDELRGRLRAAVQNGGETFDVRDVELMCKTAAMRAFLLEHHQAQDHDKTMTKTVSALLNTLRWRRERKIFDVTANISREMFKLAHAFYVDHGDRIVYYSFGANFIHPAKPWRPTMDDYFFWQLDQLAIVTDGRPLDIVIDWEGMSLSSFQAAVTRSATARPHYPPVQVRHFFVNLPGVLRAAFGIMKRLFPSSDLKTMHFVTYEQMVHMIGEDKLNAVKNGTKLSGVRTWADFCPPDALSTEQLGAKLGIDERDVAKFKAELVRRKFAWLD